MTKKKNVLHDLRDAFEREEDPKKRAELREALEREARASSALFRFGLGNTKRPKLKLRTKQRGKGTRRGTPATPATPPTSSTTD